MGKRKAPNKQCPSCQKKVHVRKQTCDCGYTWETNKPPAASDSSGPNELLTALETEKQRLAGEKQRIDTQIQAIDQLITLHSAN